MKKEIFKEEKKWYKSRTLTTNAGIFLVSVVLALADQYQSAGVLSLTAVINIVLRALTSDKIKW